MSNISDASKELKKELIEAKKYQDYRAERISELEEKAKQAQQLKRVNNQLWIKVGDLRIAEINLSAQIRSLNQIRAEQRKKCEIKEEELKKAKNQAEQAAHWEQELKKQKQNNQDLELIISLMQMQQCQIAKNLSAKNKQIKNLQDDISFSSNHQAQLQRVKQREKQVEIQNQYEKNALQDAIRLYLQEITELKQKIENKQIPNKQLENKLAMLMKEIERLNCLLRNKNEEVNSFEKIVKQRQTLINNLLGFQQIANQRKDEIENLRRQLRQSSQFHSVIQQKDAEINSLKRQIDDFYAQFKRQKQENTKITQTLAESQTYSVDNQNLKQKIVLLTGEIQRLNRALNNHRFQSQQLSNQKSELQKQLACLKQQEKKETRVEKSLSQSTRKSEFNLQQIQQYGGIDNIFTDKRPSAPIIMISNYGHLQINHSSNNSPTEQNLFTQQNSSQKKNTSLFTSLKNIVQSPYNVSEQTRPQRLKESININGQTYTRNVSSSQPSRNDMNEKVIDSRKQINNMNQRQFIDLVRKTNFFPNLHAIYLDNKQITDDGVKTLVLNGQKFPNLQFLELKNNKITDDGLIFFALNGSNFPNLHTIWFSQNQIGDDGFKKFIFEANKLPKLQKVWFRKNNVTDDGLKVLAKNGDKLKNLRELILNDNQITDEGLIYFATNGTNFTALKHFGLSSNKITDQGLNALASNASNFNNLKALYLEDTQITSKRVERVIKKYKLNFEIFK